MDVERQRIEEDLRGQIAGEVRCDDLFVQLYASDASIYEIAPLGVVRPRPWTMCRHGALRPRTRFRCTHAEAARVCRRIAGRGLIVDFSRYMRRVIELADDRRVQAGVCLTISIANSQPRPRVRPRPGQCQVTTMGSVVALDAAGSRWPLYGSARITSNRWKWCSPAAKLSDFRLTTSFQVTRRGARPPWSAA